MEYYKQCFQFVFALNPKKYLNEPYTPSPQFKIEVTHFSGFYFT